MRYQLERKPHDEDNRDDAGDPWGEWIDHGGES